MATNTTWKKGAPSTRAHEVYDRQTKCVTKVGRKKELLAWWATLPTAEQRRRYEVRECADWRSW